MSQTFDRSSYYALYSPKIEILDKDKNSITTYDSFAGSNAIHLENIECQAAVGSAGSWSLIINDYEHALDRVKLGISNRINVWTSQTQGDWKPILAGVCRYDKNIRNKGGQLRYYLSGYGTQYITSERIINFSRSASKKSTLTSTSSYIYDPKMAANTICTSILTETAAIPTRHPTIAESGGWTDLSQIENVNNFLPAVFIPYAEANQAFALLSDLTGSEWGVDQQDRFYFRYPESHTKDLITIKSEPDYTSDDPEFISYMTPGESAIGRSMRKEDGFANRLFSLSGTRQVLSASSTGIDGYMDLAGQGLATQVKPGAPRFKDLALTLSQVGAVDTSSDKYLHGKIVVDADDSPSVKMGTIGTFDIPIEDIPQKPAPIYKFNVHLGTNIIMPQTKYWIVLYQVSDDKDNTIRWHHNNDFITEAYSASKSPGYLYDDSDEEVGWGINSNGPTFSYAAFSNQRHVAIAWDGDSIDRYGLVDAFVNNSNITDFNTLHQYLYALLLFTAKPKIQYDLTDVTIPGTLFKPGSLVRIIDEDSGLTEEKNRLAEVMSVHYAFGASGSGAGQQGTARGINKCQVGLLGYYDFKHEESGRFT